MDGRMFDGLWTAVAWGFVVCLVIGAFVGYAVARLTHG